MPGFKPKKTLEIKSCSNTGVILYAQSEQGSSEFLSLQSQASIITPSCLQLCLLPPTPQGSRFAVAYTISRHSMASLSPKMTLWTSGWEIEPLFSAHKLPLVKFHSSFPRRTTDHFFQQSKQTATHRCVAVIFRKSLPRGF